MSSRDWGRSVLASAIPWQEAYPHVADKVRHVLENVEPNEPKGTVELVEHLWPQAEVHDDVDVACRARLFRALSAMYARDLKDWNRAGEPITKMGRTRVPRLWANFTRDLPKCETCGQFLPRRT